MQTLASFRVPSVLESAYLYRTDNKRPDAMILVPWKQSKQIVRELTVVDVLATSRFSDGLLVTMELLQATWETEERTNVKYKGLAEKVYFFQPLAFEVQRCANRPQFWKYLCKPLCIMNNEPGVDSFLKQRISLAIPIANAACVLGTVNKKTTFDEILFVKFF